MTRVGFTPHHPASPPTGGGRQHGFTVVRPVVVVLVSVISLLAASIAYTSAVSALEAPQDAFSGLWRTGVSDAQRKLPLDSPDPHWVVDRVYRQAPFGSAPSETCTWAVKGAIGSTSLTRITDKSASPSVPARVVVESGRSAGLITSVNTNITGTPAPTSTVVNNGTAPWGVTSPLAGWIGINRFAQDYSKAGCENPTINAPNAAERANVYVFRLRDGFNINCTYQNQWVLLDRARIQLEGIVDNAVKFVVNGRELGGWHSTGFTAIARATSVDVDDDSFHCGSNSLEIHVLSTYSHTGLLITNLSIIDTELAPLLRPKVQVLGGDLRVGGGGPGTGKVSTSVTVVGGRAYGSWAEYGIVATGEVTGMGSGSGYAGGLPTGTILNPCSVSLLTFTNATSASAGCSLAGRRGNYSFTRTDPDLSGRFHSQTGPLAGGIVDVSSIASGAYDVTGDLQLRAGAPVGRGHWVVIKAPTSTVTISSDLRYTTDTLRAVSEIPQVLIFAKNILIQDTVRNVDAWLYASDTISTCAHITDPTRQLRIGVCDRPLIVNGPVRTTRLLLYRTGNASSPDPGAAAEVFNLRADAYLWLSNQPRPATLRGSSQMTV